MLLAQVQIESIYVLTHLTSTLSAPKGVTKIAGAKPYAAKLAASPTATIKTRFMVMCTLVTMATHW